MGILSYEKKIKFYIAGPQKSGTTLLVSMLNQHPDLYCITDSVLYNVFFSWISSIRARELNVFRDKSDAKKYYLMNNNQLFFKNDFMLEVPTYDEVKWFLSALFYRYFDVTVDRLTYLLKKTDQSRHEFLFSEETLPYHYGKNIDPYNVLKLVKEKDCSWEEILDYILSELVPGDKSNKIIGEKTPGHIRYFQFLQGKKIAVIRNPIANIASYFKRDNAGFTVNGSKNNLDECMKIFNVFISPLWDLYKNSNSLLIIRFEDLLDSYEETCSRIFEHIGVDNYGVMPEFKSGVKGVYVGDKIDENRAKSAYSIFNDNQKNIIYKSYKFLFDEFYPDYY